MLRVLTMLKRFNQQSFHVYLAQNLEAACISGMNFRQVIVAKELCSDSKDLF
jgi:hypothetical protein